LTSKSRTRSRSSSRASRAAAPIARASAVASAARPAGSPAGDQVRKPPSKASAVRGGPSSWSGKSPPAPALVEEVDRRPAADEVGEQRQQPVERPAAAGEHLARQLVESPAQAGFARGEVRRRGAHGSASRAAASLSSG